MSEAVVGAALALQSQDGVKSAQWVHLLPAGSHKGRDGRGPYEVKDPAAVIRNSQAEVAGGMLPIDINHSLDKLAPAGLPSPAVGWITKLEWRKDGLWGYAEWAAPTVKALQNKEYRFLSPAIVTDGTENVVAVLRASLVNTPNLDLVALNSTETGTGKPAMSANLLPELRSLLGLNDTADEVQIVSTLKERLISTHAADPAKYVPIELFQQTVKELNLRNNGMAQQEAEAVVEVALQNQMLMPYMREWAVELCMRDRKAYDDFLLSSGGQSINTFLKELTRPGKHRTLMLQAEARKKLERGAPAQTQEDEIARNLGHTAEDMKKFGGDI